MRLLVLGAGATGGYFGGRLMEAGADVRFLVRPARAALLERTGLRILSADGDATLRPHLLTVGTDTEAEPADAILLSCKSYDLEDAIASLRPHVGPATMIVPLLNGFRHLDALVGSFGGKAVLGGLCGISATLDADGTIRHLGLPPRIVFGERAGGMSPRVEALAATMAGAKFEARASDDIVQDMWEKFVSLATLAGASCLMRAGIGHILSAGGEGFLTGLRDECVAVARAAGHAPRPPASKRIAAILSDRQSNLTASMLRDIERGGPTEGDHILGDMLARARAAGIDTPLLAVAALHVASYEARRRSAGNE